ncbi:MAG: pantoate--beta-alanine ligase [Solirubrobacteraceae bacterium]
MQTLRTIAELRRSLACARKGARARAGAPARAAGRARADGELVGLVPTMGALHDGHLSLLQAARQQCDVVVMSLFVNPAQFAAGEDLESYPRDEAADAELARMAGVDLLFAPSVEEMYPPGFATSVIVRGLSETLEGAERGAGHFEGVATVVTKLFNIVAPDVAFFGQKDAQQAVVIKRLVADLDMPVRIAVLPTVREADGLARSSRNAYLTADERAHAVGLSRALEQAATLIASGERDSSATATAARRELAAYEIEPEYLDIVDPETLEAVAEIDRPVLIAVAAKVGRARLIDNVVVSPTPTNGR